MRGTLGTKQNMRRPTHANGACALLSAKQTSNPTATFPLGNVAEWGWTETLVEPAHPLARQTISANGREISEKAKVVLLFVLPLALRNP